MTIVNKFTEKKTFFQGRISPEEGTLAGYGAMIHNYSLKVPLPRTLSIISEKNRDYVKDEWIVRPLRRMPQANLFAHITFAFRYEGINLLIISELFKTIHSDDIKKIVEENPTSIYARKAWFLYEWLTEEVLELNDLDRGNYVDLLDEKLQYACLAKPSKRHRINNNLPGTKNFCPLIWKTEKLEAYLQEDLSAVAHEITGKVHPDLLKRAAWFLLLKDSKASFDIEGEKTSAGRVDKWGKIIGQAGAYPLSKSEILRLQEIVIGDARFTTLGLRTEGGFIGERDRITNDPIPDHISAKWEDLPSLIDCLIKAEQLQKERNYPPLLSAASIAFGFVFIHPFEDGNGRLHRYLIHHILANHQFTPKGLVFPVSSVILNNIEKYRAVLEAQTKPLLDFIEWRPTVDKNVKVINDTIDLYRFFDATIQAEFLFDCVKETVSTMLPDEISYLVKYDEMKTFIDNYLTMPDTKVGLLIRFLEQGQGTLSKRAMENEFAGLTNSEKEEIEKKFIEIFPN